MDVQALIDRVTEYYPRADVDFLTKAYEFSQKAHEGQLRESGDPYFRHPFEVSLILADLELDVETIAAGLLHDVLEDTPVNRDEMEREFGTHVMLLVEGVTKLEQLPFRNRMERQAENLRKMMFAMAKDIRVILIKLADRLHNMRTLRHMPPDKQVKVAQETLDIFAPLAHRLGIWKIKWEMEDLAFRYIAPKDYYSLVNSIAKKRQQREGDLQRVMDIVREKVEDLNIESDIQGRPKHLYSIYQKMQRQHKSLDEIYDLMAVSVIVQSVKDCYAVLGVIHTLWKPIPGRFKDYIAMPKLNMYQSLHTTVIGPKGEPYEIQIRTWEMHRIAEKGVAAHWLYKEGRRSDYEGKVEWLREAVEWLQEAKDPQEFMETLKIDLFEDEVFVFTPKGDVKSLPNGATPVDFAFDVHTDVGLRCVGAKVNGRIVPLDHSLTNGDFVEILTSKNASPSRDWLNFVKTSKARNKIRGWLKEEQREESYLRGKEMLERELKRIHVEPKEVLNSERIQEVAKRHGVSTVEELLANIGFGKVTAQQVVQKITGKQAEDKKMTLPSRPRRKRRSDAKGVKVRGIDDVLIRFSRCCNPVPGDDIVGYITRGRGVSVHRTDCPNIGQLSSDTERQIDVWWDTEETESYSVEIEIKALDRMNLLSAIMNTLSEGKTQVEAVNARASKQEWAMIHLVVDIHDVSHMNTIMNKLRQIDGIVSVRRANPT